MSGKDDLNFTVFGPDGTSHAAKSYADVKKVLGEAGEGFAKLESKGNNVVGFVHIGGSHNRASRRAQVAHGGPMVRNDRKDELFQQWETWVLANNPEMILEGLCRMLRDTYGVSRAEAERMVLDAFKRKKGGNSGI